jgi:DNA-binding response OmpR family regulator
MLRAGGHDCECGLFPLTILIAEDNSILAKSIARRLRQIGYAAETVSSVKEFREKYAAQRFEALCLDLQLPDGNGLDLLEHYVRAARDDVPAVIITGTGTETDRARAEHNGAAGFLTKPFQLDNLVQILAGKLGAPNSARADRVM